MWKIFRIYNYISDITENPVLLQRYSSWLSVIDNTIIVFSSPVDDIPYECWTCI